MKRIVWHWPAGEYLPSDYEKSRYHFLIAWDGGKAFVVDGDKPPEANRAPLGSDYVQHAGGFNSDAIGIALCGMQNAKEHPFDPGKFPLQMAQYQCAAELSADLAENYEIPVTRNTMLMHSEVRPRFGRGKYKWDINYWPNEPQLLSPEESGDRMRAMVFAELQNRQWKRSPWWKRGLRRITG